jgi:hypothetical protein
MPYQTVILTTAASSAPGASAAANLNWLSGKPTTVTVYSTVSGSTIAFNVQYTLDDLQRVGGSSLAFWQNLSSAYNNTTVAVSSGSIFGTSSLDPAAGMTVIFPSAVAALRLNSSSMGSGPLVMKVSQDETL